MRIFHQMLCIVSLARRLKRTATNLENFTDLQLSFLSKYIFCVIYVLRSHCMNLLEDRSDKRVCAVG
jgi:hypothetical protein